MKVLFVTSAAGVDYLADCVFHGLVDSGLDVTDSRYLWYLSGPLPKDKKSALYGKGFTIAGNLPDRSGIDRSNIRERVLLKEFDLVVYGSIWRCQDYIDEVAKAYPRDKVVICDGEDHTFMRQDLFSKGLYFKRELISDAAFPISFAVPEEKIAAGLNVEKKRKTASIIPGKLETYVYDDELDYYNGYRESLFGVTFKKAGWDCMRHYEIAMNMCLPYFPGIDRCPA